MTVNPSPVQRALLCPLCGDPIDEVKSTASEEQRVSDTLALVLLHVQLSHTTHEILTALGTARNALVDIREIVGNEDYPALKVDLIEVAVERGLGGK